MEMIRETGCWRCKRHFTVEVFDETGKCSTCGWDHCPHCSACHQQCAEFRERVRLAQGETRPLGFSTSQSRYVTAI